MVEAIERAIDLAEARQRYLRDQHGLHSGQPRVILFTDGQPTNQEGRLTQDWRPLADRLRAMRAARRMHFFGFGVPGADSATMRSLIPEQGYHDLPELDFRLLLDLLLVATTANDPYDALNAALGRSSS